MFQVYLTIYFLLFFKSSFFLVMFEPVSILILMVFISLELTRVNPDQNIFSQDVELTLILFTL